MSDTFSKIQYKLISTIFDNLSAADLQRCRRVSKSFKTIVDDRCEELSNNIIARERSRLQSYIDQYILYADKPPFLEMLARWLDVRRVWPHVGNKRSSSCCIVLFVRHAFQQDDALRGLTDEFLQELVHGLIDAHLARWDPSHPGTLLGKAQFVDKHSRDFHRDFNTSQTQWMYEEICEGSGPFLSTAIKRPPSTWNGCLPERHLTSFECWPQWSHHGHGVCAHQVANSTFGLPTIPRTGLWSYYFHDGPVWRRVRQLLFRATSPVAVEPLFNAAVLEEISIF